MARSSAVAIARTAVLAAALLSTASLTTAFIFHRKHQRQSRRVKDLEGRLHSSNAKDAKEDKTAASAKNKKTTLEDSESLYEHGLTVKPIGTVHSIYRLCVGTPRQGLLAPSARGRIDLINLGSDAVAGLEEYSHIWVVFIFHLNTQTKNSKRIRTKVAPPALGGKKVGILATRTPHRFNPIGTTLCKLDKIEVKGQQVSLHISGLDLVDGTPVLDIKPFVPVYDSVSADDSSMPSWVADGLATKRPVTVTKLARDELRSILDKHPAALEFYGPSQGEASTEETMERILDCIQQVLSMDVRSSWQTKKARQGKFQAERAARITDSGNDGATGVVHDDGSSSILCTQQLDNLLIHYAVSEPSGRKRDVSEGSGAEDVIFVKAIQLLKPNKESTDDQTAKGLCRPESPSITTRGRSNLAVTPSRNNLKKVDTSTPSRGQGDDPGSKCSDYGSLKTFWNKAASENTPTGLKPGQRSDSHQNVASFNEHSNDATPTKKYQKSEVPHSGDEYKDALLPSLPVVPKVLNNLLQSKEDAPKEIPAKAAADTSTIGGFKVATKKQIAPPSNAKSDTTVSEGGERTSPKAPTASSAAPSTIEVGGFKVATKSDSTTSTMGGFKVASKKVQEPAKEEQAPQATIVSGLKVATKKAQDEKSAAANNSDEEETHNDDSKSENPTGSANNTADDHHKKDAPEEAALSIEEKEDDGKSKNVATTMDVGGFKVASKEVDTPKLEPSTEETAGEASSSSSDQKNSPTSNSDDWSIVGNEQPPSPQSPPVSPPPVAEGAESSNALEVSNDDPDKSVIPKEGDDVADDEQATKDVDAANLVCTICGDSKSKESYSQSQLKKKTYKCMECVASLQS